MEGGHKEGSYNQTMTVPSVTFMGILLSKARNHVFFCVLKKKKALLSNCVRCWLPTFSVTGWSCSRSRLSTDICDFT